jgi:hypothetical protein
MTQFAQPQVSTVSVLRGHRILVLTVLGALVVLTTLILVTANSGGGHGTSIPTSPPRIVGFGAGPAARTSSPASEALRIERGRSGVPLTTNVPARPSVDAGPVAGTPSAVSAAFHSSTGTHPAFPSSLTTNVPAKPVPDAGPTSGTPAAIRHATGL